MKRLIYISLFLGWNTFSSIFSFSQSVIYPDTINGGVLDSVLINDNKSEPDLLTIIHNFSRAEHLIPEKYVKQIPLSFMEMLQRYSSLQVNEYGMGNIASLTYRGAADDHTKIMWNGVVLNSASLGGTDLSLIPVASINQILLENNVNSIGGVLDLQTSADWNNKYGLNFQSDIGSFDAFKNSMSLYAGNKKIQYHATGIYQTAKNNFPYYDVYKDGMPLDTVSHNKLKLWSASNEFFIKLSKNSELAFGNLLLSKDKQIPQLMGIFAASSKYQEDLDSRTYLRYTGKLRKRIMLELLLAHSFEQLLYQDKFHPDDTIYSVNTLAKTNRLTHSFLVRKDFSKYYLQLTTGYNYSFLSGNVPQYAHVAKEHQGQVFGNLYFQKRFWASGIKIEFPFTSYKIIRPQFSIHVALVNLKNKYDLKISYKDTYRFPDLNDRYWSPGGNPDLKYESGWELELRHALHLIKSEKLRFNFSTLCYYAQIKNNIVWLPVNAVVWTPQNIAAVRRYGLENEFDLSIAPIMKFTWNLSGIYLFNRTQIIEDENNADLKNKYLAYRPQHIFKLNTDFDFQYFDLGLNYSYTSFRFTDKENYSFFSLKPYHLVNMFLKFSGTYKSFSGAFVFKINNLTNTQFESVRAYAQPLRNYSISILLSFQNNLKNENTQ